MDVNTLKSVYFIGAGGIGMSALVRYFLSKGKKVGGYDRTPSELTEKLIEEGAAIHYEESTELITDAFRNPATTLVVYTPAVPDTHKEFTYFRENGFEIHKRSQVLGMLTHAGKGLCVAGTHGKTTTTSMLTQIFIQAGEDPSAVIGGKLPLTGTNGLVGKSEHMLCEACEFVDTFLSLSPDVCVLLNIDEDHLDYFKTLDNLIASFTKFASMTRKEVIYNGDDANTLRAIAGVKDKKFITFGLKEGNDFRADNIVLEHEFASFDIIKYGENVGRISLGIPGEHNVYNALAAIAAADNAGIPMDKIIACAEAFHGAGRRFEILKRINGITIADDYAHHPRELEATLTTAMGMGFNRVWAVFQPFTYSRTAMLFDDFCRVLSIPDKTVLTEIMGSRERNTYNIYTSQLAEKIPGSVWFNTFEEVADYVVKNVEKGDLVITLGCGDIYKAAKLMIKKLEKQG